MSYESLRQKIAHYRNLFGHILSFFNFLFVHLPPVAMTWHLFFIAYPTRTWWSTLQSWLPTLTIVLCSITSIVLSVLIPSSYSFASLPLVLIIISMNGHDAGRQDTGQHVIPPPRPDLMRTGRGRGQSNFKSNDDVILATAYAVDDDKEEQATQRRRLLIYFVNERR